MSKKIDLTGQRFGRLVVLRQDKTKQRVCWVCQCDCGNLKSVQGSHLRMGVTTSCGCYQKERAHEANTTHGLTRTSLYNRWKSMRQRCCNKNDSRYNDYGARGIICCDEWQDFSEFMKWASNNGYEEGLEIDRIDNDKGYFPENCRWCTTIINNRNRRSTAKIDGVPLKIFAEKHNMKYGTVHSRYYLLKKRHREINTHAILTYANQLPISGENR